MSLTTDQELDALARFVYKAAGLPSEEWTDRPLGLARPCIVWYLPDIETGSNLSDLVRSDDTSFYAVLYVNGLSEALRIVRALRDALHENHWTIPVYETTQSTAQQVGRLERVRLRSRGGESLDMNLTFDYDVLRHKTIPEPAPPVKEVHTRITTVVNRVEVQIPKRG